MAVDLGQARNLGEVRIRFQGGSPQAGISTPGWINVYGSQDGDSYIKIAGYSRWHVGDDTRFDLPPEQGKAWVHEFRFPDLNRRGRFVGISFYGAGMAVMDELQVLETTRATRPPTGPAARAGPDAWAGCAPGDALPARGRPGRGLGSNARPT